MASLRAFWLTFNSSRVSLYSPVPISKSLRLSFNVLFLWRDSGVQMQGASGKVFRSFLLFLHNLLPINSMRACERSGAIVGQDASRIVRHWYISLTETGAVCSRQALPRAERSFLNEGPGNKINVHISSNRSSHLSPYLL